MQNVSFVLVGKKLMLKQVSSSRQSNSGNKNQSTAERYAGMYICDDASQTDCLSVFVFCQVAEQGQVYPGPEPETGSISQQGNFKWVADDGNTYQVSYVADEGGFQPQGAHLPVAPAQIDAYQQLRQEHPELFWAEGQQAQQQYVWNTGHMIALRTDWLWRQWLLCMCTVPTVIQRL